MTKNKIIHTRIDDKIHEILIEKCNSIGCTITDYIQLAIQESLEENESDTLPIEPIVEDVPEPPKPRIRFIHG